MVERSGYWDALLLFLVQLRDQKKQPRWWSYSWKTHDTEYRAARVKNFPARRNPHKQQKILWNCSLQELWYRNLQLIKYKIFKPKVHYKQTFRTFTHPHVTSNQYDFLSTVEHKSMFVIRAGRLIEK